MKKLSLALAFCLLDFLPGVFLVAGEPDGSRWRVRVEVLMVALPQDQCLALLPDLRDPLKIEGAVARLLASLAKHEALLMGDSLVLTLDGKSGLSETFLEKRFPVEFAMPVLPQIFAIAGNYDPSAPPMPTAYETCHVGARLEITPTVGRTGESILLRGTVERRGLLETEYVKVGPVTTKWGESRVGQPQFLTSRDTITTSVKNGEHILLGVHPLIKPESYIELFIIQATATPIK